MRETCISAVAERLRRWTSKPRSPARVRARLFGKRWYGRQTFGLQKPPRRRAVCNPKWPTAKVRSAGARHAHMRKAKVPTKAKFRKQDVRRANARGAAVRPALLGTPHVPKLPTGFETFARMLAFALRASAPRRSALRNAVGGNVRNAKRQAFPESSLCPRAYAICQRPPPEMRTSPRRRNVCAPGA